MVWVIDFGQENIAFEADQRPTIDRECQKYWAYLAENQWSPVSYCLPVYPVRYYRLA
jgi:hypothetical protein